MNKFLFKKKVDKSLLNDGLTLPVNVQDTIQEGLGIKLSKGQHVTVGIIIDDKLYDAKLTYVNFTKQQADRVAFQIRYTKNSSISVTLRDIFTYTYNKLIKQELISEEDSETMDVYINNDKKLEFKCNTKEKKDNDILKDKLFKKSLKVNTYEDDNLNHSIKNTNLQVDIYFEYTNEIEPKPEVSISKSGVIYYKRNRQKALNALNHAKYLCECDETHESFIRKSDGIRYTEAHHLIPMSYQDKYENSIDIEENIVSLCSNCHNEIHYGENSKELIEKLYNQRKDLLFKKNIDISLEKLLEYYGFKIK